MFRQRSDVLFKSLSENSARLLRLEILAVATRVTSKDPPPMGFSWKRPSGFAAPQWKIYEAGLKQNIPSNIQCSGSR